MFGMGKQIKYSSHTVEDPFDSAKRSIWRVRGLFRLAQVYGAWPYSIADDGGVRANGNLILFACLMLICYSLSIIYVATVIIITINNGQPYVNVILGMSFLTYDVTSVCNIYRGLKIKRQVVNYIPKLATLINDTKFWKTKQEERCTCHDSVAKSSPQKIFREMMCIYTLCTIVYLSAFVIPVILNPMGDLHVYRAIASALGTDIVLPVKVIIPINVAFAVGANYSVIFVLAAVFRYVSQMIQDVNVKVHMLRLRRQQPPPPGAGENNALQALSERHLYLSTFIEDTNEMFGSYLLAFYANSLVQAMFCTYYLIYLIKAMMSSGTTAAGSADPGDPQGAATSWDILLVFLYTVYTTANCFVFTKVFASCPKMVNDIDTDLYDILIKDTFTNSEKETASQLLRRLNDKPVVISANDYFKIDKSLLLTIFSVYLTYILVLLQFVYT